MAISSLPPERVQLEAGEVLFRQGSWGDRIYVVERGEVEIVAERVDGSEELLTVVTPGGYFGEFGPLYGLPRTATARARTAGEVTGYSTRDFKGLTRTGEDLSSRLPPTSSPPVTQR
jgi:putative ABC transport system ATP-binding protein